MPGAYGHPRVLISACYSEEIGTKLHEVFVRVTAGGRKCPGALAESPSLGDRSGDDVVPLGEAQRKLANLA